MPITIASILRSPLRATFATTLTLATALCALTPGAAAQAIPVVTGPGSYVNAGGAASLFNSSYGQRDLGGGTAFVDINPTWRFGIEAEARFLRLHTSEQVNETTYFAGPRISILRPRGPIQPYAKFLVGAGQIHLPFGYAQGTFLTYAPGAGLDYQLNDAITIRVVDVEYQLWTKFPYGALRPYGISTGISLRLTHHFHTPRKGRHQTPIYGTYGRY
jgi:opacity protein-like surface antigen